MDASQWRQDVGLLSPVDGRTNGPAHNPTCQKPATPSLSLNSDSKRAADLTIHSKQQQKDQSVDCPRCKSSNTKFCYYNNYSLTQPRYFCKSCRRYWTQGGTLRNVPVGGSSRKNFSKRSSSKLVLGMNPNPLSHLASHDPMTPSKIMMPDHQGHDLNTALYFGNSHFQELAPSGAVDKGLGLGSYMPEYPSGFSVLELKPNPGFYMDAHAGYGSNGYKQIGIESSNNTAPEWFFFPHQLGEFSKLAAAPANGTAAIDGHHRAQSQQEHHKNRESDRDQQSSGYWNHGMY